MLEKAQALQRQGQFAEAEQVYLQLLRQDPLNSRAWHQLGNMTLGAGWPEQALTMLERARLLEPQNPALQHSIGRGQHMLGRFADALQSYDRALAAAPELAAVHRDRAVVLRDMGEMDKALTAAKSAVRLDSENAQSHNTLGLVLAGLNRDDAVASFRQAIALAPDFVDAHNNLGLALLMANWPEEALESLDKALGLAPDFAAAHNGRAAALTFMLRYEEAVAAFDAAIAHKPDYHDARINRAVALSRLGRDEEAQAAFDAVIAQQPETALQQGVLQLQRGDFAQGWRHYDARLDGLRTYPQPVWRGEDLTGKTLFVHAEQDLGDSIMFARYLPLAKARGANLVFSVQEELRALLRELDPDILLAPLTLEPKQFDYHQRLLSMPLVFGTTLETIPATVPYLRAQPERVARWRERIGDDGFKIGLCWNSSGTYGMERSFPVGLLAPLAQMPGVRLINLQKDFGHARFAEMPEGMRIESLGEDFDAGPDAFLDAAAVMESLDLVISCDTAIAHLAGALGRPVWTALKHLPDWRWLLERDDSPWYPTMTLFRQPRLGDWQGVADAMRDKLAAGRKI